MDSSTPEQTPSQPNSPRSNSSSPKSKSSDEEAISPTPSALTTSDINHFISSIESQPHGKTLCAIFEHMCTTKRNDDQLLWTSKVNKLNRDFAVKAEGKFIVQRETADGTKLDSYVASPLLSQILARWEDLMTSGQREDAPVHHVRGCMASDVGDFTDAVASAKTNRRSAINGLLANYRERALSVISNNRVVKPQLTPYLRGKIARASLAGAKVGGIAKALNQARTTINYTLLQDDLRD
ncbi:hypothetical protein DL98DRAFT_534829 [Cadophora sp. DSE1049]|nr:hypothetical protein DL98DRAFT_534829 [Cadophora sp. DSE1049]